jgi:hypothetical protein
MVNNGCLIKYANYVLTGFCGVILPVSNTLTGTKAVEGNKLYWTAGTLDIEKYEIQKSAGNGTAYETISSIMDNGAASYSWVDKSPYPGNNFYRLKIILRRNTIRYSNTVLLINNKVDVRVYPNPVERVLFISVNSSIPKKFLVEINNLLGQKIMSDVYYNIQNHLIEYHRNPAIRNGIYSLVITDLESNEKQTYKLIYK